MSDEDSDLYRQEAIEAARVSTLGDIVLKTPATARFLTVLTIISACAIVLFIYIGSYTKKATVIGELQPIGGVIRVYSPKRGQVTQVSVQEGQTITAGQPLIKISQRLSTDDGEVQSRLIATIKKRQQNLSETRQRLQVRKKDYQQQWQLREQQLQSQISNLDNQRQTLRQREQFAQKNSQRYQKLLRQGFVAKETYEAKEAERLEITNRRMNIQQQLAALKGELSGMVEERAQYIQRLKNEKASVENDLAKADAEIMQMKAEQDFWLTAPEQGVVSSVLLAQGQQANPASPAVVLVPQKATYQARLYVSSAQIGFLQAGQRVWLRYEAFPYQKFGQYAATIKDISKVALLGNELSDLLKDPKISGTFYRVTAKLDDQSIQAYQQPVSLMAGMRFQADIVQEKRRLYEWILDPLYRITERW